MITTTEGEKTMEIRSKVDDLVKSHLPRSDGLRKKFDILGVVSETAIWQYIWYGESPFQIYNDVDRAFYESIKVDKHPGRMDGVRSTAPDEAHNWYTQMIAVSRSLRAISASITKR